MKTIIDTATNISKYVFSDNDELGVSDDYITCPEFIIADMDASNAQVVTDVTPPDDWVGCKYFLIDGAWSVNPDWSEPELPE